MSPGVEASAYLWSGLCALFEGLALGQTLRWVLSLARGPRRGPGPGRRGRFERGRPARACVAASLGILAAVALLIFPSKAALHGSALLDWAVFIAACGCLAGVWPRVGGGAVAALLVALVLLLRGAVSDWLPAGAGAEIARLLPFEVAAAGAARGGGGAAGASAVYRGELQERRGEGPTLTRRVELPVGEASLTVETLELRGPLAFLAAFPSGASELRLYRIVGLAGAQARPLLFPRRRNLLDGLAPLGDGAGFVPGAAGAHREAVAGLLVRSRATTEAPAIEPLQPIIYSFGSDLAPRLAPPPGDALGVLSR